MAPAGGVKRTVKDQIDVSSGSRTDRALAPVSKPHQTSVDTPGIGSFNLRSVPDVPGVPGGAMTPF